MPVGAKVLRQILIMLVYAGAMIWSYRWILRLFRVEPVPAGRDCPDGCDAADRRLDFSGDPGWRDGRHGECQQGLFQLEHVPEPRCDEPRFFVSLFGRGQ